MFSVLGGFSFLSIELSPGMQGCKQLFLFGYFVCYWDDKDHCCCHCFCGRL
uniref:Uncharacterized protein n=1 Tax=Arundo donax TaxID=35708 RepID=A0A0A9H5R5_ARUDO